jgi:hypothetical protein
VSGLVLAGGTTTVCSIDVIDGLVQRVHLVRNPDKLTYVPVP